MLPRGLSLFLADWIDNYDGYVYKAYVVGRTYDSAFDRWYKKTCKGSYGFSYYFDKIDDEEYYKPDYYELAFVVPTNWLKEVAKEMFEVEDLDYWLQSEYTTDESEVIFARALDERQIVMIDFD